MKYVPYQNMKVQEETLADSRITNRTVYLTEYYTLDSIPYRILFLPTN